MENIAHDMKTHLRRCEKVITHSADRAKEFIEEVEISQSNNNRDIIDDVKVIMENNDTVSKVS